MQVPRKEEEKKRINMFVRLNEKRVEGKRKEM
jgi:hypothetical protein